MIQSDLFNFQLPANLKDSLVRESERTGNSVASIVRQSIVEYLGKKEGY